MGKVCQIAGLGYDLTGMSDTKTGYCGCGCDRILRLGDQDCDGYTIGYIDDGGLAWPSQKERDFIVTAGRFSDLCNAWTGDDDNMPSVLQAAIDAECSLEWMEEAMEYARQDVGKWLALMNGIRPPTSYPLAVALDNLS